MRGAIIGDIIGSVYEFDNIKTKDFPLFQKHCFFTDDTVLTVATADALMTLGVESARTTGDPANVIPGYLAAEKLAKIASDKYYAYGSRYEGAGYGGHFLTWLSSKDRMPYNSCGNGSAMRVSPIGLLARTESEAAALAQATALPTHNHPDGIRGAVATALCTFAAKSHDKNAVRRVIQQLYPYTFSLNAIRDSYYFGHFQALNVGTVPYAVQAFLESESFEDAMRNVISIGGDSDTLAAITGGIAEAYYGVPDELWDKALTYLDKPLTDTVEAFYDVLRKEDM